MALGTMLIYDAELPAALLASTTELFLKLLLQILQVSGLLFEQLLCNTRIEKGRPKK